MDLRNPRFTPYSENHITLPLSVLYRAGLKNLGTTFPLCFFKVLEVKLIERVICAREVNLIFSYFLLSTVNTESQDLVLSSVAGILLSLLMEL